MQLVQPSRSAALSSLPVLVSSNGAVRGERCDVVPGGIEVASECFGTSGAGQSLYFGKQSEMLVMKCMLVVVCSSLVGTMFVVRWEDGVQQQNAS